MTPELLRRWAAELDDMRTTIADRTDVSLDRQERMLLTYLSRQVNGALKTIHALEAL